MDFFQPIITGAVSDIITIEQLTEQAILSKADWIVVMNNTSKKTGKANFTSVIEMLKGDFYTKAEIATLLRNAVEYDDTALVLRVSIIEDTLTTKAAVDYVDSADTILHDAINVERDRLNNLVTGAPMALDTLAEIAAQLAADAEGAAAILATQYQHSQELANVVHKTGNETIDGTKTFVKALLVKDSPASGVGYSPVISAITPTTGESVSMGFENNSGVDYPRLYFDALTGTAAGGKSVNSGFVNNLNGVNQWFFGMSNDGLFGNDGTGDGYGTSAGRYMGYYDYVGGTWRMGFNGEGSMFLGANDSTATIKLNPTGNTYFSGGNVGIGTKTPTSSLHIKGNDAGTDVLKIAISAADQYASIGFFNEANSPVASFGYQGAGVGGVFSDKLFFNGNSKDIVLGSGGTASLIVKAGGNIGMGTTNPSSKLSVSSDTITQITADQYGDNATASTVKMRKARGTEQNPTNAFYQDYVSSFEGHVWDGTKFLRTFYVASMMADDAQENYAPSDLIFSTNGGDDDAVERMRILSYGYVGIGIESPSQMLDVDGFIHSNSGYQFPDGTIQYTASVQPSSTVQNSLSPASTTLAPSVTAVNNGLSSKADVSYVQTQDNAILNRVNGAYVVANGTTFTAASGLLAAITLQSPNSVIYMQRQYELLSGTGFTLDQGVLNLQGNRLAVGSTIYLTNGSVFQSGILYKNGGNGIIQTQSGGGSGGAFGEIYIRHLRTNHSINVAASTALFLDAVTMIAYGAYGIPTITVAGTLNILANCDLTNVNIVVTGSGIINDYRLSAANSLYVVSSTVRNAVISATYTSGEAATVAGTIIGQKFFDANYRYEAMIASDGVTVKWIRTVKA